MSEPIKIAHVVHALCIGGLENGLVNLLNQLDERFAHTIVCLSKSGQMAERIENRDVTIIEMGLPTDRFRFPLIKLVRVFRQISPDIVHTRGWSSVDAITAARVSLVPGVIHGEHGWEAADPAGRNPKRNVFRRCLSPLVDRFVAVSDDLKNWLTRTVGVPEYKVIRIHNGVDTQKFAPRWDAYRVGYIDEGDGARCSGLSAQPSTLSFLRRALCIPDDAIVIGTVGRLDAVKDHRSLLQAFAKIAVADERGRLVIVGDGPMRGEIAAQIKELQIGDQVHMLGERQDISELLKTFDVFTLTSIAEGISNTILEAMASGLPIVATRVGGNPELVEHGVSGHLIPAQDVCALAGSLLGYIRNSDLRRSHGVAARRRAVDQFSLERMAAEYANLYLSVMGRSVGRGQ